MNRSPEVLYDKLLFRYLEQITLQRIRTIDTTVTKINTFRLITIT